MTGSPHCDACPFHAAEGVVCHARRSGHARFCRLIALGIPGYRELVRRKTVEAAPALAARFPAPPLDRGAILARRARKARIPLGVKPPPGRR